MKKFIPDLPRNVAIALATIVVSGILFAVLLLTLSAARDEAIAANTRLTNELQQTRAAVNQAAQDHEYVVANTASYEALMSSDRLIPHTRRAAVLELEKAARARGLTTLSYNFAGAASDSLALQVQQASGTGYRLSVENIVLGVGAPIDGPIYGLMADVLAAFPGSAVVEKATMSRAPEITDAALQAVSAGEESKLVEGTVTLSWRTAQAQANAAPAPGGP